MRSLTFAPEVDDVPNIDWTDPSLVVTEEGRQRLAVFSRGFFRRKQTGAWNRAEFRYVLSTGILRS